MSETPKGSRKQAESFQNAILLLVGFGVAAYFKTDPQIYGMFVLGVLGKHAGFMWGNAKEHSADVEMAKVTKGQ